MTTAPDPNDPSPFPSNPPQPAAVTTTELPTTLAESYAVIAQLRKENKNLEAIIAEKDKIIAEYMRMNGEQKGKSWAQRTQSRAQSGRR